MRLKTRSTFKDDHQFPSAVAMEQKKVWLHSEDVFNASYGCVFMIGFKVQALFFLPSRVVIPYIEALSLSSARFQFSFNMVELVTAVVPMDFLVQGKFSVRTVAYKILVTSIGTLVSFLLMNVLKDVVEIGVDRVMPMLKGKASSLDKLLVEKNKLARSVMSLSVGVLLSTCVVGILRVSHKR